MSSDWYWEQDEHLRFTAVTGGFGEKAGVAANLRTRTSLTKCRIKAPFPALSETSAGGHPAGVAGMPPR